MAQMPLKKKVTKPAFRRRVFCSFIPVSSLWQSNGSWPLLNSHYRPFLPAFATGFSYKNAHKQREREVAHFRIDERRKKEYTMIVFFRGVAQLVARLLWEQEAASSSLATPTTRKATMNRLQMRFYRGFLCFQNPEIWLECALFVPYRPKKCFTRRPEGSFLS